MADFGDAYSICLQCNAVPHATAKISAFTAKTKTLVEHFVCRQSERVVGNKSPAYIVGNFRLRVIHHLGVDHLQKL